MHQAADSHRLIENHFRGWKLKSVRARFTVRGNELRRYIFRTIRWIGEMIEFFLSSFIKKLHLGIHLFQPGAFHFGEIFCSTISVGCSIENVQPWFCVLHSRTLIPRPCNMKFCVRSWVSPVGTLPHCFGPKICTTPFLTLSIFEAIDYLRRMFHRKHVTWIRILQFEFFTSGLQSTITCVFIRPFTHFWLEKMTIFLPFVHRILHLFKKP